ncbi:hypothetical protein Fmac_024983 [Flemingia macrophylla]|uniref:Gag-pol polyprotein n=1 Tax=Flemingia macrophylla TaxID=520843 RepID=A0ABD1LSP4_9FABA
MLTSACVSDAPFQTSTLLFREFIPSLGLILIVLELRLEQKSVKGAFCNSKASREGGQEERRVRWERSRSVEKNPVGQPFGPKKVINTIAGGFAGGGTSSSARRRRLRVVQSINVVDQPARPRMPSITFTDDDFRGVDPILNDPMVISVEINNGIVCKVLVDHGSSVDILYWKTFQQLDIPAAELSPHYEPWVGLQFLLGIDVIIVEALASECCFEEHLALVGDKSPTGFAFPRSTLLSSAGVEMKYF